MVDMEDALEIERAINVCRELQSWLDTIKSGEERMHVAFSWVVPFGVFDISIDELVVWHSQADSDELMTFEACRSAFIDHCTMFAEVVSTVHPSPFSEPFTNPRSSMGLPKHS